MRIRNCIAGLVTLLAFVELANPLAADDRKAEEVKWAKRVVVDWLDLLTSEEAQEGATTHLTFLHSELIAAEKKKGWDSASVTIHLGYQGAKWSVVSEEVAPNGSEVILIGKLEAKPEPGKKPCVAQLTIRVGKDTEGGRWQITFIRIKELPAGPGR